MTAATSLIMVVPSQILPSASPIKRKKHGSRRASPRRSLSKALREINRKTEKQQHVDEDEFSIQLSQCESINAASEISGMEDSDSFSVRSSSSSLFDDDAAGRQNDAPPQRQSTTSTPSTMASSLYNDSFSSRQQSLSPRKRSSRAKLVHRECAKSLFQDTDSLTLEEIFSTPSPSKHSRKGVSASLSSSLEEDMLADVQLKNLYDDDDEEEEGEVDDADLSSSITICLLDDVLGEESEEQRSCSSIGSLYDDDDDDEEQDNAENRTRALVQ